METHLYFIKTYKSICSFFDIQINVFFIVNDIKNKMKILFHFYIIDKNKFYI